MTDSTMTPEAIAEFNSKVFNTFRNLLTAQDEGTAEPRDLLAATLGHLIAASLMGYDIMNVAETAARKADAVMETLEAEQFEVSE